MKKKIVKTDHTPRIGIQVRVVWKFNKSGGGRWIKPDKASTNLIWVQEESFQGATA
ncbi:MAG: hypothetical protein HY611_03695 [Elusimicrobia bacterium]|nr:hypothetical protein [Elusimicrobiota bacterium]